MAQAHRLLVFALTVCIASAASMDECQRGDAQCSHMSLMQTDLRLVGKHLQDTADPALADVSDAAAAPAAADAAAAPAAADAADAPAAADAAAEPAAADAAAEPAAADAAAKPAAADGEATATAGAAASGGGGPAPAPCDTKPGACTPQCSWRCSSVKCDEVCKPKCQAPRCQTRCNIPTTLKVATSGCKMECEKPNCAVVCPERGCPAAGKGGSCPICTSECSKPCCKLKCPDTNQECQNVCENPLCEWECKAPEKCPEPKCQMVCETPRGCRGKTYKDLPPLKSGESVISSFETPISVKEGLFLLEESTKEHMMSVPVISASLAPGSSEVTLRYHNVSFAVMDGSSF